MPLSHMASWSRKELTARSAGAECSCIRGFCADCANVRVCGKDRIGYLAYCCGAAYSICLGVTRGKGFLRSHRETSVRARFLCSRGSGQENPMGRGPLVIIS